MKAADLDKARDLLAEMALAGRLGDKLAKGERLRLTVGQGGDESEIVLSAGFSSELRERLIEALRHQALVARRAAIALGVEP